MMWHTVWPTSMSCIQKSKLKSSTAQFILVRDTTKYLPSSPSKVIVLCDPTTDVLCVLTGHSGMFT